MRKLSNFECQNISAAAYQLSADDVKTTYGYAMLLGLFGGAAAGAYYGNAGMALLGAAAGQILLPEYMLNTFMSLDWVSAIEVDKEGLNR